MDRPSTRKHSASSAVSGEFDHPLSPASYQQSNGRAELAVKTAKRMVTDNTDKDVSLNTDKMVTAMLAYKNTPLPGVWESPAQIIFSHPVSDSLPRAPQEGWPRINDEREIGMAKLKVNRREINNDGKSNQIF